MSMGNFLESLSQRILVGIILVGRLGVHRDSQSRVETFRGLALSSGKFKPYGQTANEDPRKSEFESQRILNVKGGLS